MDVWWRARKQQDDTEHVDIMQCSDVVWYGEGVGCCDYDDDDDDDDDDDGGGRGCDCRDGGGRCDDGGGCRDDGCCDQGGTYDERGRCRCCRCGNLTSMMVAVVVITVDDRDASG